MDSSASSLSQLKLLTEHPELIEKITLKVETLLSGSIIEVKDFSIGTDQSVAYIKTSSNKEVILKVPKSSFRDPSDSSFFSMHLPSMQAWCLNLLKDNDVLASRLFYLDPDDKFFIETFLPSANLGQKEKELSKERRVVIMQELAQTLKKYHQIKSKKFGYMKYDDEHVGKFDNWFEMFAEVPQSIKGCSQKKGFTKEMEERSTQIYEEQLEYFKEFKDPCLLHADLTQNNIRIAEIEGEWHFSGLIDFGDVLSGDCLYDIGNILGNLDGEWEMIDEMEKVYLDGGSFTVAQRKAIRFYALYFSLWWFEGSPEMEPLVNHPLKRIEKLLQGNL